MGTVVWEQIIAFIFEVEEIYVGVSEEFVGFYQSARNHTPKIRNYSEADTKTSVNWTLATYNACSTRNKVKFHRIRSVQFEYILVYMTL